MNISSIVATIDKVKRALLCSVGIIVVVPLLGSLKSPKREAALSYQEKSPAVIPRSLRIASMIPFTVIADYCYFLFVNKTKTINLQKLR